jgi:hypothetical protein
VKRIAFLLAVLFAASVFPLLAQRRVQMRNMYERLYLVVPMVGSGTAEDPRRPMYAPLPAHPGVDASAQRSDAQPADSGIIAFAFQESDDGAYALVEFVARDRAAFKLILEDRQPNVKVFEKGKSKKGDVEQEFRKYKHDFDLDSLVVNIP